MDTEIKKTAGAREAAPASKKAKIKAAEVDLTQMITVRNGYQGTLVYKSARTGETYIWDNFGDEQEIELRELRNAKSSAKSFFENNWFLFNDEDMWVVEFLGVNSAYKNALSIDGFDDLFSKKPAEIEEVVKNLSSGQKASVACRARQLIEDGVIDSIKVITILEKNLGVQLIEK